jgi:formate hydrogenlyase subunit 3/multisubunit Na+/H+ antiporter MnhD subunit
LVGQSAVILGLGFALMLGAFPFHSWLPMISQGSHPSAVSFLYFLLPSTVVIFSLNFLERYTFLRTLQNLEEILSLVGAILIFIGGVWTAVQNNPKRVFGYTVLVEAGYSLLSLSLFSQGGLEWLLMLLPARALGYWLLGYSMSLIEEYNGSLELKTLQGFARRYPFLSVGLLLAQLSIAGLPLLAAFPTKFSILRAATEISTSNGIWIYLGSFGLFFFTFRLMVAFIKQSSSDEIQSWNISENMKEYLPILLIMLVLVILGIFPNLFGKITTALTSFPQLQ